MNMSAQDAVRTLISVVGENPDRHGLEDTPQRVVAGLLELMDGYNEDPAKWLDTTFPNDGQYSGPVIVAGIQFTSMCEHHMLPFTGWATICYEPGDVIVGLSKLPRMFYGFARRLQVQERLTQQALDCLLSVLNPRSAVVVATAAHSCMTMRGVRSGGMTTTTSVHGDPPVDLVMAEHRHHGERYGR